MFIDQMKQYSDDEKKGVIFTGTVFQQNHKRPIFVPEDSSITSNTFLIDKTEPGRDENYTFFCTETEIDKEMKKLMVLDLCNEPNDVIVIQVLHTKGQFYKVYVGFLHDS